jgi:hypothetical protein
MPKKRGNNMLSKKEQKFIADADKALARYGTVEEAAKSLKMNPNSFYTRFRRLGYRLDKQARLVPIHEPTENNNAA